MGFLYTLPLLNGPCSKVLRKYINPVEDINIYSVFLLDFFSKITEYTFILPTPLIISRIIPAKCILRTSVGELLSSSALWGWMKTI